MAWVPSREQCADMLLSLLPTGAAWQSDPAIPRVGSVLKTFFYALSGPWLDLETEIAAALDEFFCATAVTTRDAWLADYGLPDDDDPFGDDLCRKVAGIERIEVALYAELAAAAGWDVSLRFLKGDPDDGEFPGVYATLHAKITAASSAAIAPAALLGSTFILGAPGALGGIDVAEAETGDGKIGRTQRRFRKMFERLLPAHVALTMAVI